MKVYEIVAEKQAPFSFFTDSMKKAYGGKKQCLHRKWTKFKQGTICKALRVVMVDYDEGFDQTENSYWSCFKNILCCNSYATKKSDLAIEFKIIEDFDELVRVCAEPDSEMTMSHTKRLSKKSFFLPVNESKLNNDIDLIPISQMAKNLSLNNLQTINNLIFNNMLINNSLELKLFDENPFLTRYIITAKSF